MVDSRSSHIEGQISVVLYTNMKRERVMKGTEENIYYHSLTSIAYGEKYHTKNI